MSPNKKLRFHTYHEIMNHSEAWQDAIDDAVHQAADIQKVHQEANPDEVLFIGCGSTHYLARTAAHVYQRTTGKPGRAFPSSELILFPEAVLTGGKSRLLVPISRSGATTETLKAIELFADDSTIGITCYETSEMVGKVKVPIIARQAHEQSIAQTRSFSAMLVATIAAIKLMAGEAPKSALLGLADISDQILSDHSALSQELGTDTDIERFFFLGSGPFYGLACEAMLKMKEMSLSYSEAYHFLEFRHGPMSMINDRSLVVGLLSDAGHSFEIDVLTEMGALGARTLALTPHALKGGLVDHQIVLPDSFSDLERGPLYLPVLQMLAFERAVSKGLNPDHPTNLSAVVVLNN